jgi:hypothetical protein
LYSTISGLDSKAEYSEEDTKDIPKDTQCDSGDKFEEFTHGFTFNDT